MNTGSCAWRSENHVCLIALIQGFLLSWNSVLLFKLAVSSGDLPDSAPVSAGDTEGHRHAWLLMWALENQIYVFLL